MSGELIVSFSSSPTKSTRIIRKRTSFKITPATIHAWFTLHCPHIIEPSDAMINRAIYVFKTLLHRANGYENNGYWVMWRECSVWDKNPTLKKTDVFGCLFFSEHIRVCNKNPQDVRYIGSRVIDIVLNDSEYGPFESYWPRQPILTDILATLMLISRRLLSGSQYYYEFPREIVEKIVCL
jgi:hypothetical protein